MQESLLLHRCVEVCTSAFLLKRWVRPCRRLVHRQHHAHSTWGVLGIPGQFVLPSLQQEGSRGIQEGSGHLGSASPQCHSQDRSIPCRSQVRFIPSVSRCLCLYWGRGRTQQIVSSIRSRWRRRWAYRRPAGIQDEHKLCWLCVRKHFHNGLGTLFRPRAPSWGVSGPHPKRCRDGRASGTFPVAPACWHFLSFCFGVSPKCALWLRWDASATVCPALGATYHYFSLQPACHPFQQGRGPAHPLGAHRGRCFESLCLQLKSWQAIGRASLSYLCLVLAALRGKQNSPPTRLIPLIYP